jgi:hypothetical protein
VKQSEWAPGVLEQFRESYDYTTCVRTDGSYYGTGGTCRKGTETTKPEKEKKETKSASEGLFSKGNDVDIAAVDSKAEAWRKENGLNASPGTVDWKHDRVHVLAHEFLGGQNKINEWIGENRKGPSPAEETIINMIHRDAALRQRKEGSLDKKDLEMYFKRDINFVNSRGNIPDKQLGKYFDGDSPNVDKFIDKFEEIRSKPNYDKLLDASASVFTNAGDFVFNESGMISRRKIKKFMNNPIVKEAMRTDGVHEVARLASMAGVLEKDLDLLALSAKLSPLNLGKS